MVDGYVSIDVRGNTIILDPRSKILTTLVMVLGIAISVDYFQILLYAILIFPMLWLYRPRIEFLKRIPMTFPFLIFLCLAFYFSIGESVEISVLGYQRTYDRLGFVGLIIFRYLISVTYTYILIFSETSHVDLIEALSSFKISKPIRSILLLINRLSTRLTEDYNKMLMAAKTKGALTGNWLLTVFVKLRILSRILSRTTNYSEVISYSLVARGFDGEFSSTTRHWTSEGISVTILGILFTFMFTAIPWMRA